MMNRTRNMDHRSQQIKATENHKLGSAFRSLHFDFEVRTLKQGFTRDNILMEIKFRLWVVIME